jgi:hypothetical protein
MELDAALAARGPSLSAIETASLPLAGAIASSCWTG